LAAWLWFHASTGGVLISIFFLANFSRVFHVTLAGPYWTLAIEEQFYLIWPRFVRRLRVSQLQKLAWVIVIGEPILRLIDTAFHHSNFFFTFFRCDGLALGALLACQLYRGKNEPLATQNTSPNRSATWILVVSCVFLAATGMLADSPGYAAQGTALFLSAVNVFFYSCIRIAVESSGARFLAVFRSRLLVFFGLISYCVYMSQTYVIQAYDDWRHPVLTGNSLGYWVRIATIFCTTIALCVVSRYALELPFMSLRRYVLRQPKSSADAVTTG
jgi:peptidoglycan/LPS O-acetylase OafA/YrhL